MGAISRGKLSAGGRGVLSAREVQSAGDAINRGLPTAGG